MSQMELKKASDAAELLERVVVAGDLSTLSATEKLTYYRAVCESVGMNPLTKPLDYIYLNNKLVLYANKNAAEQLRDKHGVSITRLEFPPMVEDIYSVVAYATDKDGRTDSELGCVSIAGLRGEARSNAMMKTVTKAKRRVTLSLCGLGLLDETEVGSIPDARPVRVDETTGEVLDVPAGDYAAEVAQDRVLWMAKVKGAADALGLDARARAMLWEKHVGAGKVMEDADPAQLSDLYDHLSRMRKEKK